MERGWIPEMVMSTVDRLRTHEFLRVRERLEVESSSWYSLPRKGEVIMELMLVVRAGAA